MRGKTYKKLLFAQKNHKRLILKYPLFDISGAIPFEFSTLSHSPPPLPGSPQKTFSQKWSLLFRSSPEGTGRRAMSARTVGWGQPAAWTPPWEVPLGEEQDGNAPQET